MRIATLTPVLVGLVTACAPGADPGSGTWVSETDTLGDTIVVRTVSGAVWGPVELVSEVSIGAVDTNREEYLIGEVTGLAVDADGNIYAYDPQGPTLRKYGPDGVFVATFGRKGGGPGEYARSDGGLLVLPDGRLLLRDPGNARFTIYHPDGSLSAEWLGRGGVFTGLPPVADSAGNVYEPTIQDWPADERPASGEIWRWRVVRYTIDGTPVDTLDLPEYDYERAILRLEVRRGGGGKGGAEAEVSLITNNVPFAPVFWWSMSPLGRVVAGVGNRYAIDQYLPDGTVLRIERQVEPVPIGAAEKADAEARAVANMRRFEPSWRWNGPPIPDHKPVFNALFADLDGRVWVQRPAPGEPIPEDQLEEPREVGNGVTIPPQRYREPVLFDVFEPDGRFLGTVRTPAGFSATPRPVARGDHLWGVVRDELGVNTIQRFRISAHR